MNSLTVHDEGFNYLMDGVMDVGKDLCVSIPRVCVCVRRWTMTDYLFACTCYPMTGVSERLCMLNVLYLADY